MNIQPSIFKAYDIRGIYPQEINEENIGRIIDAIYIFFSEKLKKPQVSIALSRDMRLSTPTLFKVVSNRLMELGARVTDLGLLSTPSFYFAVSHYQFETGIQVTASHNPKDYNGLKFVLNTPSGIVKIGKSTGMEEIRDIALSNRQPPLPKNGTNTQKTGIMEDEVQNALTIVGNPTVNKFKIVADPANAMGATYLEALFKVVPATLVKMNFNLDGSFPAHQPDPLNFENLKPLQKKVLEEKADLGLAPDGDGDRLFFIDEKGQVVSASFITALVARELLKKYPGETILYDVRNILTPQKIIEENGGKGEVTKVGHAFITEAMHMTKALFAGESSGHYFFRATGNAESQLPIILTVLKVMSDEKKPLSQIIEDVRRSYESGEINFKVTNAQEIVDNLKQTYHDGELLSIDGISISFSDWRFNIRTSNTEPLLRLNVEGIQKDIMEEKKNELVRHIETLAKQ